jgi:hypothetical protein
MTRIKRWVVAGVICSVLSFGLVCVLLLEDRELGIPLPISVPFAFAVVQVLAAALLLSWEIMRAQRHALPADAVGAAPIPRIRRRKGLAEGLVLLDYSGSAAPGEHTT